MQVYSTQTFQRGFCNFNGLCESKSSEDQCVEKFALNKPTLKRQVTVHRTTVHLKSPVSFFCRQVKRTVQITISHVPLTSALVNKSTKKRRELNLRCKPALTKSNRTSVSRKISSTIQVYPYRLQLFRDIQTAWKHNVYLDESACVICLEEWPKVSSRSNFLHFQLSISSGCVFFRTQLSVSSVERLSDAINASRNGFRSL